MLSWIRDVRRQSCDPIQHGKHLSVALEDTIRLGMVDDRLALWMRAHLLLGKGGTQEILGQLLLTELVSAVNAHLMMNANAGVQSSCN